MIIEKREFIQEIIDKDTGNKLIRLINTFEEVPPDPKRKQKMKVRYTGFSPVTIHMGNRQAQETVGFDIKAKSIQEAFVKFEEFAKPAVEKASEEIKVAIEEARNREMSKIVLPGGVTPDQQQDNPALKIVQ